MEGITLSKKLVDSEDPYVHSHLKILEYARVSKERMTVSNKYYHVNLILLLKMILLLKYYYLNIIILKY